MNIIKVEKSKNEMSIITENKEEKENEIIKERKSVNSLLSINSFNEDNNNNERFIIINIKI